MLLDQSQQLQLMTEQDLRRLDTPEDAPESDSKIQSMRTLQRHLV